METKLHLLLKPIIWQAIGIALLGGISYAITGDWKTMMAITVSFNALHLMIDYFHQQIWQHIKPKKIEYPLAESPATDPLEPQSLEALEAELKEMGHI